MVSAAVVSQTLAVCLKEVSIPKLHLDLFAFHINWKEIVKLNTVHVISVKLPENLIISAGGIEKSIHSLWFNCLYVAVVVFSCSHNTSHVYSPLQGLCMYVNEQAQTSPILLVIFLPVCVFTCPFPSRTCWWSVLQADDRVPHGEASDSGTS